MWFKICLVSTLAIASAMAEAPFLRSAPYPASGWRPQKPFNLPGEFQRPTEFESKQQQPQAVDIEISKERVDFAGQIQSIAVTDTNAPQNAFLPPNNDDSAGFLNQQQLPYEQRPHNFAPDKQQFFPQPQAQPQQRPVRPQSQPQNFRPQQLFPDTQSKPAHQYGAPANEPIHIVYPEPRKLQSNDEADEENRAAIEALKAAVEAYNRVQTSSGATDENTDDDQSVDNAGAQLNSGYPDTSDSGRYPQGQYYVLGADNSLQRVMYTTSQDEEERRTNGFTAQLRYTPVGAVRDPIFRYNNRGQLVRILKK